MPCRFASSGTVATSRSASRAILALNAASNFLRDLVISVLHRLRQSRTLHTLTFGPISGVHFRQRPIAVSVDTHGFCDRPSDGPRVSVHSLHSSQAECAPRRGLGPASGEDLRQLAVYHAA